MKLKTGILVLFLVIGLLGVPNCIFAQEYEDSSSNEVIQSNFQSEMLLNSLTPLVKGSSGGGKSSSGSSASKAVKKADGDDDDDTEDSGWNWITVIIILVVLFGLIGILVWYFILRKR